MANFYGQYVGFGAVGGSGAAYIFPKEVAGYIFLPAGIDRVSFTSDANATDVGDTATGTRLGTPGNSSETHAYCSGGYSPGTYTPNTADVIERMSFASKGTASDVGDLVFHIRDQGTSSSETYGYTHGGLRAASDPTGGAGAFNVIWRFQMVASANATDVGNLDHGVNSRPAGHSDIANAYGYTSGWGAYDGSSLSNYISRYAMVSSGDSSDVGDLTINDYRRAGASSETHGYSAGGMATSSRVIDKFAFASSANATKAGDLLAASSGASGVSSTTYGYALGGNSTTNMDKWSFSSDADSTDVGDLTSGTGTPHGSVGSQE